jgi:hypothetical protein
LLSFRCLSRESTVKAREDKPSRAELS